MENDLVLALDCDGVLVNSVPLLDKCVGEINYVASDEFGKIIAKEHRMREKYLFETYFNNDLELYNKYSKMEQDLFNKLLKVNRITKDEVLEEIYPIYQNRINYFKIYSIQNVFAGVFEIVKFFQKTNRFKKIYIVTQFNAVLETLGKSRLFKTYLSGIEIIFIPFHDKEVTPYIYDKARYFENGNRQRTNKAEYFAVLTGEDPKKTIYIDDSVGICQEAEKLGAKAFLRDRESADPLKVFHEVEDYMEGETDKQLWEKAMKDEKVLKMIDF